MCIRDSFGLYGGVPRYEGGEKRLRSDHCAPGDPTEVVVEFSTTAGRFRVTRSPDYERPAKRGGGMTTQAAAVALEERIDGAWIGRAARAVDVAHELDGILQLTMQQFLQVILLAQGRFARFLLADSKERQSLLRKLFGTDRFDDYQSRFDERRRASEQTLGAGRATTLARIEEAERLVDENGLAPEGAGGDVLAGTDIGAAAAGPGSAERATDVDGRLDALARAQARADYRAERRAAERDEAEATHRAAAAALVVVREERQAQAERDRARSALARLDAETDRIAADRRALDDARAAEAIRGALTAAERAHTVLETAAEAAETAAEGWAPLVVADPTLPDGSSARALRDWAQERTRESGAWTQAADAESRLPALAAAVRQAEAALASAEAAQSAADAERAALPAEVTALIVERDTLRRRADRAPDLARSVEQAFSRLTGAREAEQLALRRSAQADAVARREDEASAAFSRAAELRRRREAGMAGELALALVEGEPCSVCGSTTHPRPAEHSDPVSAADVAAATEAREQAAEVARHATSALAAIDAELAAATARADGRTLAQADAEHGAAVADHAASQDAQAQADHVAARLQAVQERSSELDEEAAVLAGRRAETAQSLALARQALGAAEEIVEEARGDCATVAERIAAAAESIGAAQALARAREEVSRRESAAAEARTDLAQQLANSSFVDESAARAALRPAAEQAALDERITAHAVERRKEREILLDLELRALPEDPIDEAPALAAEAAARTAWTAAVDAASRTATTAAQLGALRESARAAHEKGAEAAREHEILQGLADAFAGRGSNSYRMSLETFVLAAELEEIVDAANLRLSDMSSGRYALRHSDARAARGAASGLGIVVFDAFTGQTRPPQSLSGGETFLSSLALALGLAEVVTARAGGIQLDTLFIDEGFGSLDGETLEIAMRTLDELRAGGRTVGVISHVEAMQEQIPAQIAVRATADGPSVIEA